MKQSRITCYCAIPAVLTGVFIFTSQVQADEWKYVMEEGLTDPQGMYATRFKEEIEKNSDHTIEIYPVGTLGESADAMEQAQAGLVQFIDDSRSRSVPGALSPANGPGSCAYLFQGRQGSQ